MLAQPALVVVCRRGAVWMVVYVLHMRTIIEPFRIKAVEPIRMTTLAERQTLVAKANYNLFSLHADDVVIDLLTDSGTCAMSSQQWAALMQGDESYAGSPSFYRFEAAVRELMPFRHIIPTHQGRAAEAILFSLLGGPGRVIPSNTHFDTTRGNIEATGADAVDLVIPEGRDPSLEYPFKGNMDLDRLAELLEARGADVPVVMLTITNNAGGGQPVSLANIRATAALAHRYGKPLFIDGCRFAENAYFIKLREPGQHERPVTDIVRDMFADADGMTMSAKKDAFANIGGWLALNDDVLAAAARNRLILTEGFLTYGGLAGRDLDAIAQGLREIVDEDYLRYRLRSNEYIGERLGSRRVYTQSHADYVIEVFGDIVARRSSLRGLKIIWQPPQLRHFTAHFAPLVFGGPPGDANGGPGPLAS